MAGNSVLPGTTPGGTSPSTTGSQPGPTAIPDVSSGAAFLMVLAAGAVLVVLADPFPTIVDGLLILILVGVILQRSPVWLPWLQGATAAFKVG